MFHWVSLSSGQTVRSWRLMLSSLAPASEAPALASPSLFSPLSSYSLSATLASKLSPLSTLAPVFALSPVSASPVPASCLLSLPSVPAESCAATAPSPPDTLPLSSRDPSVPVSYGCASSASVLAVPPPDSPLWFVAAASFPPPVVFPPDTLPDTVSFSTEYPAPGVFTDTVPSARTG